MYDIGICDDGKNTCASIASMILEYAPKKQFALMYRYGIRERNYGII